MNGSRSADPALIAGWVAARSVARGLPLAVAEHGGWRVDTRTESEWCRYVFATPDCAIADLARRIDRPRVFVKLCAAGHELARLLPPGWRTDDASWVMTADIPAPELHAPSGYVSTVTIGAGGIEVRITGLDGTLAASGYAAEAAGVFVYDRIVTDPAHRRRGLGSVVMALLGSRRQSDTSRQILVATGQGRSLYEKLGWHVHAPYTSAVSPDR